MNRNDGMFLMLFFALVIWGLSIPYFIIALDMQLGVAIWGVGFVILLLILGKHT